MTSPQQGASIVDVGNTLLAPVQVRLETGAGHGPQGRIGVLTLRSATTTFTVMLGAGDLRKWAGALESLADSLSVSGKVVPATVFDVAALHQQENGRRR